jgi:hypothetical protein
MPGGRLTYEDRRKIGAGLAAGQTYAAVARRLGRPTSTVSREVERNGGRSGYRPDRADRAARERARRQEATPATRAPVLVGAHGRDPAAVRDLEARLTVVMQATGLSWMPARILACLCTVDDGGLTSSELVARLRVSPASISTAVGLLAGQELIRRERHGRHERYVLDGQIWVRAWLASARRNDLLADASGAGVRVLGPRTPAGARLAEMSRFLRAVGRDMVRAAERWGSEGHH